MIFGGWNPIRAAFGAYLFGVLQSLASVAQDQFQGIPTQVLTVAPFVLMIFVLVLTSGELAGSAAVVLPRRYTAFDPESDSCRASGRAGQAI